MATNIAADAAELIKLTNTLQQQISRVNSISLASTIKDILDIKNAVSPAIKSINQLESEIKKLDQKRRLSVDPTEIGEAQRQIRDLQKQIDSVNSIGTSSILPDISQVTDLIKNKVGSFAEKVPELIMETINTGVENVRTAKQINFATNGHGAEAMDQVSAVNQKYGLNSSVGTGGFQQIAQSTRGRLGMQDQVSLYEGAGSMVAATGMDDKAAQETYKAIADMAKDATISVDDINNKIGAQLPNAMAIAANAMGKTQEEFKNMLDNGQVLTTDFLPSFANELKNDFSPAAVAMADDAQGSMNRLMTSVSDLKGSFADILMPVLTPFISLLGSVLSWIQENKNWIEMLGGAVLVGAGVFLIWTSATEALILVAEGVVFVIEMWEMAQKALNLAMKDNPIGLIVTVIAALAAGVAIAWNKFDGFRGVLMGVWEVVKGVVKSFAGLGEVVMLIFQGDWSGAMEKGKEIAATVGDFFSKDIAKSFDKGYQDGVDMVKKQDLPQVTTPTNGIEPIKIGQKMPSLLSTFQTGAFTNKPLDNQIQLKKGSLILTATSTAQNNTNTTNKATTTPTKPQSDAITSGGQKQITININKEMISGGIHIAAQTMQQGQDDFERRVKEIFLRILNSANAVQI